MIAISALLATWAPNVGPTDCESKLLSPFSSPNWSSSSACTLVT